MSMTFRRLTLACALTCLAVVGAGAARPGSTDAGLVIEELAWSPDARSIAYVEGPVAAGPSALPWRLHGVRVDGSTRRQLVSREGAIVGVSWSPDGRHLAFESMGREGGDGRLHIITANGRPRAVLAGAHSLDWWPRGDRIVYGRGQQLVVADADGRPARAVGTGHIPAWSPDGRRLAFARRGAERCDVGIYVARADGSGVTRVSAARRDNQPTGPQGLPSWSPDGSRVAYSEIPCRRAAFVAVPRFYVVPAVGGREAFVGTTYAVWSPTSRTIATENSETLVLVQPARGRRVIVEDAHGPSWSPDGSRLAYTARCATCQRAAIAIVQENGHRRHKIAQGQSPAWSPDGKLIAFTGGEYREGDWNSLRRALYVVRPGGKGLRRLAATGARP